MPSYKFLPTKYIECLLAGDFFLGSLNSFRMLEEVTGDDWIGDTFEGRSDTLVDYIKLDGEKSTPNAKSQLETLGIVFQGGNPKVEVVNSRVTRVVECFVFCFSNGNIDDLIPQMCAMDSKYAYDGCVQILDAETLAAALQSDGLIDGKPLKDEFDLDCKPISYQILQNDFKNFGIITPDPFVKALKYKTQQEIRITFIPKVAADYADKDSIIVTSQKAKALLVEKFRDRPIGSLDPDAVDHRTGGELVLTLINFIQELDILKWAERNILNKALPIKSQDIREQQKNLIIRRKREVLKAYWALRRNFGFLSRTLDVKFLYALNPGTIATTLRYYVHMILTHNKDIDAEVRKTYSPPDYCHPVYLQMGSIP